MCVRLGLELAFQPPVLGNGCIQTPRKSTKLTFMICQKQAVHKQPAGNCASRVHSIIAEETHSGDLLCACTGFEIISLGIYGWVILEPYILSLANFDILQMCKVPTKYAADDAYNCNYSFLE